MAIRPTLLFIGDKTAAGDRPVSELTAINASYDDPQVDCDIWNIQAQAFQATTPGTNTDTNQVSSDKWSYESRIREGIRAQVPVGKFWIVKYALTSQLLHTGVNPSWIPGYAANAIAGALTQLTNAAAAAVLGGDTLRVDGIVISIQTTDFRLAFWREFGAALRHLIDHLRSSIAVTPGCAAGSIRSDGAAIPTVIVEHHYKYVVNDTEKAALTFNRMQIQGIESEADRIRVVRTHNTLATDNVTFSAGSMVALAADIGNAFFAPVAYNDGLNPEARIALLISDSILEGTGNWLYPGTGGPPPGTPVAQQPPAHQQTPMTGAHIWQPFLGEFGTLAYGVNHQVSMPAFLGGFGCELSLCDEFRTNGDIWLVKSTQSGSFGSLYNATRPGAAVSIGIDPYFTTWAPNGQGQLFELGVRGWFVSAVDSIRRFQAKKPVVELVGICIGTNDLTYTGSRTNDVVNTVRSIVVYVTQMLQELNIQSTPRFVVCVPSQELKGDSRVDPIKLNSLREALLDLPNHIPKLSVLDLSKYQTFAFIHPLAAENTKIGTDLYDIWRDNVELTVQPMFMPSMTELRSALRLGQIQDPNEAKKQIDMAVQTVSTGFYSRLGPERIAALQANAFSKAPSNNGEFMRVFAATLEVKWVRAELIRVLPMMFMDGANASQSWRDEAAFRETSYLQTRDELKRLDNEIQQGLKMLLESTLVYPGQIAAEIVAPACNPSPGSSISVI